MWYSLIFIYIYIYIYTYIYIYSICYIVVTSLKCWIGRAKYINITNAWIEQQDNSSILLWVSCFLQSSGVYYFIYVFLEEKIIEWTTKYSKTDFNPYCSLHYLTIVCSDGGIH